LLVTAACAPAATSAPPTAASTAAPPPSPTAIPTSAPAPTQPPSPTATATLSLSAKADNMFQTATKVGVFSGSVLIAQNGQVILSQGYGFADREKKIPNTPQTKFRIAELTRGFTAMAILILQEQGKLNVQDKICAYLTDCPASWKSITLHQLLTHTSGIPDTITFSLPPDQMIADAKAKPLDFQPGDKWGFSSTDYVVLGKIIEAVSGQSYETFLQKNIFEPLQMSNTGYDHNQADLAVGYKEKGDSAVDLLNSHDLFAVGALYSTVEDLYRWEQALDIDKLVSLKALEAMFTPYVSIPVMPGQGNGYGLTIRPDQPRFVEEAGWSIEGFKSVVHRYPDDRIAIIILTNQQDVQPWYNADEVGAKLFGK
jgi:CubicO group peptidase (beta-lactamase class C family)